MRRVQPITVSLVLLTWNRSEAVRKSLSKNIATSGYPIHEIIHVDNGSEESSWCGENLVCSEIEEIIIPTVSVLNSENLGVAKGYNRGLALATGSHIVITGCDRIMPRGWLKAMVDAAQAIPNTGAISVYSQEYAHEQQRYQSGPRLVNGINIREADVCEARFHSRDYLLGVGYFREDFGQYSYEDCEWRDRAVVYARKHNLINYVLPDLGNAIHLEDGNEPDSEMMAMKKREKDSPAKLETLRKAHAEGNPYFNPYCFKHGKNGESLSYQGHADQHFGHITYSQNGEDLFICNIFQQLGIEKPSYLDLGAHHPTRISNTQLLYLRGSRGVNVEANPGLIAEFEKLRPQDKTICAALSVEGGEKPFYMWDGESGRNTFCYDEVRRYQAESNRMVMATLKMPTITLDQLIEMIGGKYPDFLNCDLEGLDFAILDSADFSKSKPKVICVEKRDSARQMSWKMLDKGYRDVMRMGENIIFVDKNYVQALWS